MIECKGLCKDYSGKAALKNVDLTFEKGKIYGLMGRNGAGKTTLLSIMSSQNPATKGTVTVDGEPVWENPNALAKICFSRELNVSQTNNNGLGAMKVKEYLKLASVYYPNWDKNMAETLIKEFELDIKKKMGELSKGMLSMVTIVVALASKAEYTFLDEPVAGLDPVATENLYHHIEEINKSGITVIMVSHDIHAAIEFASHILHIGNKPLFFGTKEEYKNSDGCHCFICDGGCEE